MGTVSSSSSPGAASSSSCLVSRYALGLFFILLVSLIWSAASILVQFLYDGMSFDSPFLLTYIGTSLFILLLPSRLLWERRTAASLCSSCGSCCDGDEHHDNIIIPWSHNHHHSGGGTRSSTAGYTQVHHEPTPSLQISNIPTLHHHHHHHPQQQHHHYQDHVHTSNAGSASGGSVQLVPNRHDSNSSYCSTMRQQDDSIMHDPPTSTDPLILLSHEEHFRIALKIAPVWFIANWSYNASLAFTSISSSTVLASTSSLFTFLIAVICRDEDFSTLKLTGVVLGVCGSILTGWHDLKQHHGDDDHSGGGDLHNSTSPTPMLRLLETLLSQDDNHNDSTSPNENDESTSLILGDFLSLVSAVGYAVQVILIRVLCPRDEQSMSMQLMLGYVGLINALMFSPVAIHQVIYGTNTTTSQLTWTIFGCLVVKGLFDNVLSDYLWARAVVLTTATVATVGLGLTIPLAFLSDWMLGHAQVASVTSILGALGILVGFILVNVGNNTDDDDVDEYPPDTHRHEENNAYDREHHLENNHGQEEEGDEEHVVMTEPNTIASEASIGAN